MKIISLRSIVMMTLVLPAYGQSARRVHAENELLARAAVRISVGQSDADLTGRDNRVIQAAVDYVGQLGGGVVEVGPGEYLMRDSLHMRSGVTVRGAGPATVLKKCESSRSALMADGDFGEEAVSVADADHFNIGDGIYIATGKVHGFHTTCATILNKQGNYLTLSRPLNADCLMSDGAFAAGIFPVISAYHIQEFRIGNLLVDGNRGKNELIDGCRGSGIYFYQGDAGVIKNCTVRNYAGDGISFQQSNDVKVMDCRVENCEGGGIHPGSGAQRSLVKGCEVSGNGRDGFFFCWRVRDAVVEGNHFFDNAGVGISIGHKDSGNLIQGNTVTGNQRGGIYWRNETEPMGAHRNQVVENKIEGNGKFQVFVDGETQGTVIRGNRIGSDQHGATGIRLGKAAGTVILEDNVGSAANDVLDERGK